MTLEICVIDTDTGFLYEWNGSQTVNFYHALQYARYASSEVAGVTVTSVGMWMMEADKPTAEDFIDSVKEHIENG